MTELDKLMPISTKARPPTEADGQEVYGWVDAYQAYDRVSWDSVATQPKFYTFWLPLDALPRPEDQE